jgi:hypothetical protein
MKEDHLASVSKDQLNLVLSFFPRVDAKSSVVLAVNTGMVGYLAAHLPSPITLAPWELIPPSISFLLSALSYWHLYKGAFPKLEGGNLSLVYFQEIAKRTEAKFIDEFVKQSEQEYAKDLLGQAWRNAEILKQKFSHLKWAFVFLAWSVLPWAIALGVFAMRKPPVPSVGP